MVMIVPLVCTCVIVPLVCTCVSLGVVQFGGALQWKLQATVTFKSYKPKPGGLVFEDT